MTITFARLSDINIDEIIDVNTHAKVVQHMPLAKDNFGRSQCIAWVKEKETQWNDNGYGPWAFIIKGKFAGWGGLQREDNGDPDFALVLHPDYWGFGHAIFKKVIEFSFVQKGFSSITVLLPPTRKKLKALFKLGFVQDGELTINNERFIRYRLYP